MSIHKFVSRNFSVEVDFKKVFEYLKSVNKGKNPSQKIKLAAILMKAVAITYAYTAPDGTQPYRRLSGYPPLFPWQQSFESKTIDISLMLVREFNGNKNQTLNYRFKAVDNESILDLSKQLFEIQTVDENQVPQFQFLKKLTKLPLFLFYLIFQLTKIPSIRAISTAPTSISILNEYEGEFFGEHINVFSLGKINQENYIANLNWTVDHRLGFGVHFGPFLNHIKGLLEAPNLFLDEKID